LELYEIITTTFGLVMLLLTVRELMRRKKGILQYSFWIALWVVLVLVGIVPQFYSALLFVTQALGMYTPIHFVTTFSVMALFGATYYLGRRIAELDDKISAVVQHVALQTANTKPLGLKKDRETPSTRSP